MSVSKLISPNDLQNAACDAMLSGRQPVSHRDWELCANFWACNIKKGCEVSAIPLIALLFDCPLPKASLIAIAKYQMGKKP